MKKLKGYIFSRPFFGERAPQHIQNIILRDYCKRKKINFLLSSTEYTLEKSTYILNEIIENIRSYDGIIFYSFLQLPEKDEERQNLYKTVIKNKKELHFAVENLILKNKNDRDKIENLFSIKKLTLTKNKKFQIGKLKNFITNNHKKTKRNYLERMSNNKIKCMKISKKYGKDYWDGDRKYGYGGYKYIPKYHESLAKKLIKEYNLNNYSKILDIGCGKGFLLYEIRKILNKIKVVGLDISKYAKKKAKMEVKKNIICYDINKKLKFNNNYFDLVLSINTLHNLKLENLDQALKEIERVGKKKFLCVESFRNEKEFFNLQCWALTAETLIDTKSWKWMFTNSGYTGDFEFIYFE